MEYPRALEAAGYTIGEATGSIATALGGAHVRGTAGNDLTVDQQLTIAAGATLEIDGGSVTARTLDNSAGGTFTFTAGRLSVGTFVGDLVNDGGAICPGASAGPMAVQGSLVVNAGSMEIEVTGGDISDVVVVDGDVTLAGALELSWLPVTGDLGSKFGGDYDILTYTGAPLDSTFDSVVGELMAYYVGIDYAYDLGDGRMAVRVTLDDLLDGDCNLDARVDRLDLLALRDGLDSAAPTWREGDLDLDGAVTCRDYLAMKGGASPTDASPVPEPASVCLLALGALAAAGRRRRR